MTNLESLVLTTLRIVLVVVALSARLCGKLARAAHPICGGGCHLDTTACAIA